MITDAPQTTALRGQPSRLAARPSLRSPVSMLTPRREDGTVKGPGYFGEVYNTADPDLFSTEASYHVNVRTPTRAHGHRQRLYKRRLCPLLVPGLAREEIAHLVDGGEPTPRILSIAAHWAEQRIAVSLSPFADWTDTGVYQIPALEVAR